MGAKCVEFGEFDLEDFLVKEQQCSKGLILRACCDLSFDGEVGEECFDLGWPHFAGMAFIVEDNVANDPIAVGFFGADGVVQESHFGRDLIEEFGRVRGGLRFHGNCC